VPRDRPQGTGSPAPGNHDPQKTRRPGYTVSTRAVINGLYARLPANRSELVLFDMNHFTHLEPLIRPGTVELVDRLRG
jgi:hypothetical protein